MIHFVWLLLAVPTSSDARFHPAGADVYVEVPDVKATCAAYAEAPLVKTLRDPSIARIVEAAKAVGPDLGAMFAGMMPTPDPARPDDRFWPWSALTSASMSLAGLDAPAPASTPWTERASGWIVLDFADAAAAAQAMSAIGATAGVKTAAASEHAPDEWVVVPPEGSKSAPDHGDAKNAPESTDSRSPAATGAEAKLDATLSIDGVDAAVVRHELDLFGNKLTFWIAQSGARIVGGIGRAQPKELALRLAKPETSFLAQRAQLAEDKGLQAPCGTVIARAWSDLERLPVPDEANAALGPELVDLAMAELAPFVGQRGVHRLQLCKDQFVWESSVERIGAAKALDDLYGSAPIPASTARFVPKDAVGAWLLCVQPAHVEALMERVLAQVTTPSASPATDVASGKTTPPGSSAGATPPSSDATTAHPSAALGNSAAIFLMPVTPSLGGGGFSPNTQIVIELKDATAFQSAFEAWIAHVRALDPTLKVEDKPYHKRPAYTFTRGATAGADEKSAAPALHPTLVIMPDRVLIATTRQYAQSEVRRIEAATADDTNALMGAGAIPADAFEVSWMDWGKLVGKLYDLARGFIPLMMQGSKTTFDVSELPTSAELFRFIKPSTTTTARVDGKLYKRSVTSLGPETPLALVALSVAATSQFASKSGIVASTPVHPGDEAEVTVTHGNVVGADGKPIAGKDKNAGGGSNTSTEGSRKESSEVTTTSSALRDVKTGLAVYRSQFGRVPDTLDDLLKGTDAFPNGFLDGGAVPKDGWSHALVYSTREKGAKFDLRSCGPNGIDDHGGGDDVLAP